MAANLLLAVLYDGTLILVCGVALWRGERPERIGAAANLMASVATALLRYLDVARGAPTDIFVLIIDGSILACFFWLATQTTRFWPVWAFGFALADVLVSIAGNLIPSPPLFAYQTGLGIYAYLALGALAAGTFQLPRPAAADHHHGFRSSSPRSYRAGLD